ncbi:transcription factor ETV7 [Schistocerca serialis cubense]|uniref:transcription factor ETV7 n=1 Tax=Schistocerca serialis cubense TaxID=2023355 RepID=UPI00214EB4EB|nr:transcription factor ETV7 [Schistocerca serialis cubense]
MVSQWSLQPRPWAATPPHTATLRHTQPPPHAPDASPLPADPRSWSREHVSLWLQQMQAQHGLPHVAADRFLMNGKALCLMTVDMFLGRVPLGGKLLYKDFQLRLGRAMHSCS